jgi:hypothetical protein
VQQMISACSTGDTEYNNYESRLQCHVDRGVLEWCVIQFLPKAASTTHPLIDICLRNCFYVTRDS